MTSIEDKSFNDFFADCSPILQDFEQALQNNDSVLIGDLSEYEICPRLRSISEALKQIYEKSLRIDNPDTQNGLAGAVAILSELKGENK